MSAFQLMIIHGPDKDKAFTVQEGVSHVLGRSQDASFKLNDMRASRTHCEITWNGERVRLVDRGSSGGTFVNGAKVSQTFLKPGDHIKIGETVLRLQIEDPTGATTVTGVEEKKPTESDRWGYNLAVFSMSLSYLFPFHSLMPGSCRMSASIGRISASLFSKRKDIIDSFSSGL